MRTSQDAGSRPSRNSSHADGRAAVVVVLVALLLVCGVGLWWFRGKQDLTPVAATAGDRHLAAGLQAVLEGETAAALEHFRAALPVESLGGEAVAATVLAHAQAGDVKKALAVLDSDTHALRQHPALQTFSEVLRAGQDAGGSARGGQPWSARAPADGTDAFLMGLLLAQQCHDARSDDWNRVHELMRQAVAADERSLVRACELMHAAGHLADATETRRATEDACHVFAHEPLAWLAAGRAWQHHDPAQAERCFREACRLAPQDDHAWQALGNLLRSRGKAAEALKALEKALKLGSERPAEHVALGDAMLAAGKPAEALEEQLRAQALDADRVDVQLGLAAALASLGRLEEARGACKRATEIAPRRSRTWSALGEALAAQGRFEEALAPLRRAVSLNPRSPRTLHGLAVALRMRGHQEEAMQKLLEAIELDPDGARHHVEVGILLSQKGLYPQAVASLRKAVALDSGLVEAHQRLGETLLSLGLQQEAVKSWKRILELKTRDAGVLYRAGGLLQHSGDLEGALEAYQQATRASPEFAEAWCNLGQLRMRLASYRAAEKALERGHSLGSRRQDWQYPSAQWLERARAKAALERRLVEVLEKDLDPMPAECLSLAETAQAKSWNLAAAELFRKAFDTAPADARKGSPTRRFLAAVAAARVAQGIGVFGARPSEAERREWLGGARGWLLEELEYQRSLLDAGRLKGMALRMLLQGWSRHPALAPLRQGGAAWNALSPSEKRVWTGFWEEVQDLSKQVGGS